MRVINIFPAVLLIAVLITSGLRPAEAPIHIAPAGTDVREYRYIEFLMMPKEEPVIRIMEATAYCYGAKTSTGTVPTPGRTVAVDPTVIPYGTELSINGVPGYVAEDCGGDIKGDRLDIFVEDYPTAMSFGRRQVEVRVLKVP